MQSQLAMCIEHPSKATFVPTVIITYTIEYQHFTIKKIQNKNTVTNLLIKIHVIMQGSRTHEYR